MIEIAIAALVALSVFFHGQFDTQPYKAVVRVTATVIVTTVMAWIVYAQWGWQLGLAAAAITAIAFCWGPEIGWNKEVMLTQSIKGSMLAIAFPFGVIYGIARPFAYWVGYTKFTKYSDEIARAISGVSLGACVYAFANF
jgi:hypothetical protein